MCTKKLNACTLHTDEMRQEIREKLLNQPELRGGHSLISSSF